MGNFGTTAPFSSSKRLLIKGGFAYIGGLDNAVFSLCFSSSFFDLSSLLMTYLTFDRRTISSAFSGWFHSYAIMILSWRLAST
jgi:hypothetical protein